MSFRNSDQSRFDLEPLQEYLFSLLKEDASRSNVELAEKLGVSEKTIRNYKKDLFSLGMKIQASISFEAEARIIFLVSTRPGTRFAVAQHLQSFDCVKRVLVTNGITDLILFCEFDDNTKALRFEIDVLREHTDITNLQDCSVLRDLTPEDAQTQISSRMVQDEDKILGTLLKMPRFRSVSESLHWLASFLRRVYKADRATITTNTKMLGGYDSPLGNYLIASNIPEDYPAKISQRIQESTEENVSVMKRIVLTNQHVYLADALSSPLLSIANGIYESLNINSMLGFPMKNGAKAVGAIALYFEHEVKVEQNLISSIQRTVDLFTILILNQLEEGVLS